MWIRPVSPNILNDKFKCIICFYQIICFTLQILSRSWTIEIFSWNSPEVNRKWQEFKKWEHSWSIRKLISPLSMSSWVNSRTFCNVLVLKTLPCFPDDVTIYLMSLGLELSFALKCSSKYKFCIHRKSTTFNLINYYYSFNSAIKNQWDNADPRWDNLSHLDRYLNMKIFECFQRKKS